MTFPPIRTIPVLLALAACAATTPPEVARQTDLELGFSEDSAPPPEGAAAGTCWAADRTPRTFEQVIAREPAADGAELVRQRREPVATGGELLYFETPCTADLTPELLADLQRALAAREVYAGEVTGRFDPQTREAIRIWQSGKGLNSAILSMETARDLGLIAYGRPEPAAPEPIAEARQTEPGPRAVPADAASAIY